MRTWLLGILGAILVLVPRRANAGGRQHHYTPGSEDAMRLFERAAARWSLPVSWGRSPALHAIVANESGGWVGRPNYQFGDLSQTDRVDLWPTVWHAIADDTWRSLLAEPWRSKPRGEQSSATGLGQLTSTNIRTGRYYPAGVAGIGVAEEEAAGMLRYIAERYGSPDAALAHGMKSGKWMGY